MVRRGVVGAMKFACGCERAGIGEPQVSFCDEGRRLFDAYRSVNWRENPAASDEAFAAWREHIPAISMCSICQGWDYGDEDFADLGHGYSQCLVCWKRIGNAKGWR